MEMGDEQIRIIALIADHGDTWLVTRQIVGIALIIGRNQQFVAIVIIIQVGLAEWTVAVDTFQIQAWATIVPQAVERFESAVTAPDRASYRGLKSGEEGPARGDAGIVEGVFIALTDSIGPLTLASAKSQAWSNGAAAKWGNIRPNIPSSALFCKVRASGITQCGQ